MRGDLQNVMRPSSLTGLVGAGVMMFYGHGLSVAQEEDLAPPVTFEHLGEHQFVLDWEGNDAVSYLVEHSTDLVNWFYLPELEQGEVFDPIGLMPLDGSGNPLEKLFVRVVAVGNPTLDPKNADFDGDGLSNWHELTVSQTDPLESHSTGSGLPDGQFDTDADGLPDAWEQAILDFLGDETLTIADIDPQGDVDGDGISNLDEYLAGLNPYQSDSNGDGLSDLLGMNVELWLGFDAEAGNVVPDLSGQGRDGVTVGTPSWQPQGGIDDGALAFGGGGDAVELPASVLDGLAGWTLSLWFQTAVTGANQALLSGAEAASSPELVVSVENGSTIRVDLDGGVLTWDAGRELGDDLWHHLVLVRDAASGELRLWLDGAAVGTPQSVSSTPLAVDAVVLGQKHLAAGGYDPALGFAGKIDVLRVYSVALSDAHALELFGLNDLDSDGLPDDWEMSFFGNLATLAAAGDDLDGDGMSNREEFEGGTDPGDYYNGVTPMIEVVSGTGQSVFNGERTDAPIVFRVTSDGTTPLVGAPVELEHLEALGGLELPDSSAVVPSLTLTTDEQGEVPVYFRAD